MDKKKGKQKIVPITKEEMGRLMEAIEKTDEFDFMLFSTLRGTGRRIGELVGISEKQEIGKKAVGKKVVYITDKEGKQKAYRVDKTAPIYEHSGKLIYGVQVKDIDFEKGKMKVWILKRRNYIQDETILGPELIRLISSYIRKYRLGLNDYVFRREGRGLRQINNRIKKYGIKAKINHPITTHNFRHYFITELRRKGWAMENIRVLTGHKEVASLSSYDHIIADDLRDKFLKEEF